MKKKFFAYYSRLPAFVRFLIIIYLHGIAAFTIFRLTLFLTDIGQLRAIKPTYEKFQFSVWAFQTGLRFDTVVSCYMLALPALMLSMLWAWKGRVPKIFYRLSWYYLLPLYTLAFFICAADIPYFHYNFSRLSAAIFNWLNTPDFVFSMIVEEPTYSIYFLLFAGVLFFFFRTLRKPLRMFLKQEENAISTGRLKLVSWRIPATILFLFVVFMGVRGRRQAPIRVENAFLTNFAFINLIGLNPVFTLMQSFFDHVELMNPDLAAEKARVYLGASKNSRSPLERGFYFEEEPLKKNVVLVLMESMSAEKMGRYGNRLGLTPVLDSLAAVSWSFDHIYSAGKHTFNGIYSTLYSFPGFLREHPMTTLKLHSYSGLPWLMQQQGYRNEYFTTHYENFDNAGNFLTHNYFKRINAQNDYPKDKVHSIFGVPDHVMFEFSIPRIREMHRKEQAFFVTMLTTSDHGPYMVPDDIPHTLKPGDIKQRVIEYADWSIGHFLALAKKEAWYRNTIFVFIADHGAIVGNSTYDMPLSYHHVPLIIFSPDTSVIQPRSFDCLGGQMDVYPTLAGLLKFDYVNNTFGIDLLRETRPYIYFSADDKIGCLDRDRFYVWRLNGEESLYDYTTQNTENLLHTEKAKADSMRDYALSMVQCSKWIIEKDLCGPRAPSK